MDALIILNQFARRFLRDRHGGAAIEMALVFPFLTLMILGAIETGWMLWTASTLDFAVEEAARCASVDVNNCGTQANIQAVAAAKAMGLGMNAGAFTVSSPACGKQVSAIYVFNFAMPFRANFNVTIPATSCYPLPPPP
jgi:Flp pilus assembly protein TadG